MARKNRFSPAVWLAAGVAVAALADEPAQGQEANELRRVIVATDDAQKDSEDGQPGDVRKTVTARIEAPPYWLGVECERAGAALRAHLKLGEDDGLVVRQVSPDSPAAKAGIQPHDVLVQFNDAKLSDVPALVKAVTDAKEQEATLVLIRQGEKQEVKIAPAKRPDHLRAVIPPGSLKIEQFHRFLPPGVRLPLEEGKEPLRMLFVQPGVVGAFGVAPAELPADSSLTIAREGDGPAKITYKQGDKTWETTSEKIDELPEEVRPLVRQALGQAADHLELHHKSRFVPDRLLRFPGGIEGRVEIAPIDPNVRVEKLKLYRREAEQDGAKEKSAQPPGEQASPSDESAVEALRQAVEELRKEVEELRKERSKGG